MITMIRTASIIPGQQAKAKAFAKEFAAILNATNGTETRVSVPIGGNPNRIRITAHHENLAALETSMTRLANNPAYLELLARGPDLFVSGTLFDEIWRDA